MKSFYKQHDEVMARIQQQHQLCVTELAAMERQLNLNINHFESRVAKNEALENHGPENP